MAWRPKGLWLVALSALLLVAGWCAVLGVAAQKRNDPNKVRVTSTPTPRPQNTPRPHHTPPRRWPVHKPTPTPTPIPPPAQPTLPLSLQWQLLKPKPAGVRTEVEPANPGAVYGPSDRLRLSVTVGETGYLYVIHQETGDASGSVLLAPRVLPAPKRRARADSNVPKILYNIEVNRPLVIPQCQGTRKPCWLALTAAGEYEAYTLVYSRRPVEKLSEKAAAGLKVTAAEVEEYVRISTRNLKRDPQVPGALHAVKLTNLSVETDIIVERVRIRKK
jgi:hypothetical protein